VTRRRGLLVVVLALIAVQTAWMTARSAGIGDRLDRIERRTGSIF
jgi:hypothetical protein